MSILKYQILIIIFKKKRFHMLFTFVIIINVSKKYKICEKQLKFQFLSLTNIINFFKFLKNPKIGTPILIWHFFLLYIFIIYEK